MKLLAIVLAAVLAASVFAIPAYAQTQTFFTEQQIKVTYKGGASQVISDYAEFEKFSLTSGSKEIDYFEFRTLIESDGAFTLKTISGLNPTIKVLNAKGDYVSVSQSGANYAASKYLGASNIWQVYYLKVSASTIDNLIGQRTSDFDSEIRFATHSGSNYLTISTDKGNYQTLWAIAKASFKALKSGVITDPAPGGTGTGDTPTGKVYQMVIITNKAGQQRFLVDSKAGQIKTFDVAVVGQGEPIESVTWSMRMQLDRDVYNVGNALGFANNGATDNYGVTVDGKGLANEHTNYISSLGGDGRYELLKIKVLGSEIEKNIQTEIANDGTLVYKSGELKFYARESKFTLKSPTNTYTISIPQQEMRYNLLSSTVSGGGGCEIEGEDCEPATPGLDLGGNGLFIVGGVIAAVGAVVAVAKKRR